MAQKPKDPLKLSRGDIIHTAISAGLSAVPLAGGPAVEIFQAILAPPLSKRRDAWIKWLAESVDELIKQTQDLNPETLSENPKFITAVTQATQIALRTHHQEKLEALRNAVLNVGAGTAPDETLQHMMLELIDRFTPTHLRILAIFDAPDKNPDVVRDVSNLYAGGLSHVLEAALPELRGRRDVYDQIWKDLHAAGLVGASTLHTTMTGRGLLQKNSTDLGAKFLKFIASPLSNDSTSRA